MRLRLPRRLDHGEEASLVEHLDELRQRLFWCVGAVAIGCVVGYVLHRHVERALKHKLPLDVQEKIQFLKVTSAFTTALWMSFVIGLVLAMPVILYQAWSFFTPALSTSKAALARVFAPLSVMLAIGGGLFGYYVVLPASLKFLTNYDKSIGTQAPNFRDYVGYCMAVILAMAVVFEIPLFVVGLTQLGALKTSSLRKNRKIGYFAVFCVGMCLPGPDFVTTFIEIAPLFVLYEGAIWLSVFLDRLRAQPPKVSAQT